MNIEQKGIKAFPSGVVRMNARHFLRKSRQSSLAKRRLRGNQIFLGLSKTSRTLSAKSVGL